MVAVDAVIVNGMPSPSMVLLVVLTFLQCIQCIIVVRLLKKFEQIGSLQRHGVDWWHGGQSVMTDYPTDLINNLRQAGEVRRLNRSRRLSDEQRTDNPQSGTRTRIRSDLRVDSTLNTSWRQIPPPPGSPGRVTDGLTPVSDPVAVFATPPPGFPFDPYASSDLGPDWDRSQRE